MASPAPPMIQNQKFPSQPMTSPIYGKAAHDQSSPWAAKPMRRRTYGQPSQAHGQASPPQPIAGRWPAQSNLWPAQHVGSSAHGQTTQLMASQSHGQPSLWLAHRVANPSPPKASPAYTHSTTCPAELMAIPAHGQTSPMPAQECSLPVNHMASPDHTMACKL
jgi:hypothetical protein